MLPKSTQLAKLQLVNIRPNLQHTRASSRVLRRGSNRWNEGFKRCVELPDDLPKDIGRVLLYLYRGRYEPETKNGMIHAHVE